MQNISVDSPFQSLTGVFVTAFCEYGITCLQDAVALARAVEYPRDKVIHLNGDEYHRALRRWWQLVDFASGLYSIDWARIQVDVSVLTDHILTLVSKVEAHHLLTEAINCNFSSFAVDRKVIGAFIKDLVFTCEKSTTLAKHRPRQHDLRGTNTESRRMANIAMEESVGGEETTPVAAIAKRRFDGSESCYLCKKALKEHPNRKFCVFKCTVCNKPRSEHPNGEYCNQKN